MQCPIIASVLFAAAAALTEPDLQSDLWERMASTLVAGDTLLVERDGHPALTVAMFPQTATRSSCGSMRLNALSAAMR